jgi:hypothetical protein
LKLKSTNKIFCIIVDFIFSSSLSSVAPPDVWYRLAIPKEVIDKHLLSALQLEAIVYACQRHETILGDGARAGFLIGEYGCMIWLVKFVLTMATCR